MSKQYMIKAKTTIPLNFSIQDKDGKNKGFTFTREWSGPISEEDISAQRFQKLLKDRRLLKKEIVEIKDEIDKASPVASVTKNKK